MSRMPKFSKGIKVRHDASRGLWRINCHFGGQRWSHGSDRDKDRAIAIAKDLERRLANGEDIRPLKLRQATTRAVVAGSVREVGDRWLVDRAKNNAANTNAFYDQMLRGHIYPLLGDLPMTSKVLTRARCIQFAKDLIGRPRARVTRAARQAAIVLGTRKGICTTLGCLCAWAYDHEILASNPAENLYQYTVDKHELPKATVVWSHAQAAALLRIVQARQEDWYLPLKFAIRTGLRVGELVELRWSDLEARPFHAFVQRQCLRVAPRTWTLGADGTRVRTDNPESSRVSNLKGRQARMVEIGADLWAELEAHRKAERAKFLRLGTPQAANAELVFTSPRGARLNVMGFERRYLEDLCARAKVPTTSSLHVTRHTFATVLLMAGEELEYVSRQLGHRDTATTERHYKHWLPDDRFVGDRRGRIAAAWAVEKKGKGRA